MSLATSFEPGNYANIPYMHQQNSTATIRATATDQHYPHHRSIVSAPTSVHVCVEGVPFQYQLTDDDLIKVFSRYGCVSNISILDEGASAIVQFTLPSDAARATTALDGKVLNGVHGALRVTLFPGVPTGRQVSPVPVPYEYKSPDDLTTRLAKKFTCRFDIPSEIEKEFHISKRIIGQKGVNMKKIVSSLPSADAAKLRLRGRGSGFLEGPSKQESNEPLHLCVSCRDADSYSIVIREVTALLEDVYTQYANWSSERGFHRSLPRVAPRNHPDVHSGYTQQYEQSGTYPTPASLYPPSWTSGPHGSQFVSTNAAYRSEYGQTPSPQSLSTHPGVSAVNTPPEVASPSSGNAVGSRSVKCGLDVQTIERMIEERNEARRICNFKEADRIRDLLRSYGIGLMDEPGARGRGNDVTTWRYGVSPPLGVTV
jgi:hypothetical protein